MTLNSEECTLVATAYAHSLVKEYMERSDKEFKDLIQRITERRVPTEILRFSQEHA